MTLVTSTFFPTGLPAPESLKRIMQSLAMLDAILEEEWEYRYFSFNARWSPQSQMGSMRNGEGDDLFAVFSQAGCFVREFDLEAAMSPWRSKPSQVWSGVLDDVPASFSDALNEAAFHMEDTTFCIWFLQDAEGWRKGDIAYPRENDPDGSAWMLAYYEADPEIYRDFAGRYYEVDVPIEAIERIYRHEPLSRQLVQALGSARSYGELVVDAVEIGYPVSQPE